ncbi:hypothetical protein DFH06DRAFT_1295911 [Mycena polygramma]|nr:hypothetical protein DFH06DRAFT_1295911 [Mycena polygramma]
MYFKLDGLATICGSRTGCLREGSPEKTGPPAVGVRDEEMVRESGAGGRPWGEGGRDWGRRWEHRGKKKKGNNKPATPLHSFANRTRHAEPRKGIRNFPPFGDVTAKEVGHNGDSGRRDIALDFDSGGVDSGGFVGSGEVDGVEVDGLNLTCDGVSVSSNLNPLRPMTANLRGFPRERHLYWYNEIAPQRAGSPLAFDTVWAEAHRLGKMWSEGRRKIAWEFKWRDAFSGPSVELIWYSQRLDPAGSQSYSDVSSDYFEERDAGKLDEGGEALKHRELTVKPRLKLSVIRIEETKILKQADKSNMRQSSESNVYLYREFEVEWTPNEVNQWEC